MSIPVIETLLPLPFGVVLALHPATDPKGASIAIERTTDSAGAPVSGSAAVIATVDAGTRVYHDYIGGLGPYWYRARHVRQSATAGPYTSWAKAVPTVIPGVLPNVLTPPAYLHSDTTTRSHTGDTTETAMETVALPVLYPYRKFQVRCAWGASGTAGIKVLRVYMDDGTLQATVARYEFAAAGVGSVAMDFVVEPLGTATAQSSFPVQGSETSLRWAPTNDLTIPNDLIFSVDLGNSADTAALLSSEVLILEPVA